MQWIQGIWDSNAWNPRKVLSLKVTQGWETMPCFHILLWFSRLSQMGNCLTQHWFCQFLTDQTHFGWNGILIYIFFQSKIVTSLDFNTFPTTQMGIWLLWTSWTLFGNATNSRAKLTMYWILIHFQQLVQKRHIPLKLKIIFYIFIGV